ncbi:MAG: hypothetical protein WBF45_20185 [Acidobacteriaceae bacterium]|jgi:hypothetical protein
MKSTIYARAVAKAISFPEQIEVEFQPVDSAGSGLGFHYKEGPYSWDEVKRKFFIDEVYGLECEGYFAQGFAALIMRPQEVKGRWPDPGDPDFEKPHLSK